MRDIGNGEIGPKGCQHAFPTPLPIPLHVKRRKQGRNDISPPSSTPWQCVDIRYMRNKKLLLMVRYRIIDTAEQVADRGILRRIFVQVTSLPRCLAQSGILCNTSLSQWSNQVSDAVANECGHVIAFRQCTYSELFGDRDGRLDIVLGREGRVADNGDGVAILSYLFKPACRKVNDRWKIFSSDRSISIQTTAISIVARHYE
jgi:hypothetical protein